MKNYYSISIPKPCHENWNAMSQREKGKFCSSCSKTVIDFSKMNTYDIQDFINENKNNRICGHFKQTQLDSINLHIPSHIIEQHNNFHKIFLLALLITMGTSSMNCTNKQGDQQKIDSVEVIDTLNKNKVLNILEGIPVIEEMDSLSKKKCSSSKNKSKTALVEEVVTDGELFINTVGDMDMIEKETHLLETDSIKVPEITEILGALEVKPNDQVNEEIVLGLLVVETPPEFKNTPKHLSIKEKRDYFSKEVSKIVSENFNTSICLELEGRQRVNVQFKIDKIGNVFDIKVRAPHPKLEDEAKRVMSLLPQFIPAKQAEKPIIMIYTLPIIFQAEEQ